MTSATIGAVVVAVMGLAALRAAEVDGTVVIQRRLTKGRVTAPASAYDRGVSVALGADPNDDPLAWERSQVVVYLEGQLGSNPVTATMEQKNRRFLPETLAVPVGSEVSGRYTIVAWHKVAGFFRQTVEVTKQRGAAVQFFIPLDESNLAKAVARR